MNNSNDNKFTHTLGDGEIFLWVWGRRRDMHCVRGLGRGWIKCARATRVHPTQTARRESEGRHPWPSTGGRTCGAGPCWGLRASAALRRRRRRSRGRGPTGVRGKTGERWRVLLVNVQGGARRCGVCRLQHFRGLGRFSPKPRRRRRRWWWQWELWRCRRMLSGPSPLCGWSTCVVRRGRCCCGPDSVDRLWN